MNEKELIRDLIYEVLEEELLIEQNYDFDRIHDFIESIEDDLDSLREKIRKLEMGVDVDEGFMLDDSHNLRIDAKFLDQLLR